MRKYFSLVKRNCKLFFKDKGMFFCSLITPLILLVLFVTFLGKAFKESYINMIPAGVEVSEKIINGLAGGQLLSSLLAVSCVTVSFCANMLMVQDKMSGARKDLLMTGLKKSELSVSYYVATLLTTLIIAFVATFVAFIYLAVVGWYLSFVYCVLIFLDVLLLTMFGTAISSLVNHFLNTQGQVSAVATIVSSMYGFISGAYMPIATFSSGLQSVLKFMPSTYGSSIIRNHCMNGALNAFKNCGIPEEAMCEIRKGIDCDLFWGSTKVPMVAMYGILIATIVVAFVAYVLINRLSEKKKRKN